MRRFLNALQQRLQPHWTAFRWNVLTSEDAKYAMMEEIIDTLRQVPETFALLEMAEKNKIPIMFDPSLLFKNKVACYVRDKKTFKSKICLMPFCPTPTTILAHELRHMWQDRTLYVNWPAPVLPLDRLFESRVREADAIAFQRFFDLSIEDQKKAQTEGADEEDADDFSTYTSSSQSVAHPRQFNECMREGFLWYLRKVLRSYDYEAACFAVAMCYLQFVKDKPDEPDHKELATILGTTQGVNRKVIQDLTQGYLGVMDAQEFESLVFQDANPHALKICQEGDELVRAARQPNANKTKLFDAYKKGILLRFQRYELEHRVAENGV